MRKINVLLFVLLLLNVLPTSVFAETEIPIKVLLNGKQIQFTEQPIIRDGTTLVQFRPIFENLGFTVKFFDHGFGKTVTGYRANDDLQILLNIGDNKANVRNKVVNLEVAPQIINESTFVPLRFIAESSGSEVVWNSDDRSIQISTPQEKDNNKEEKGTNKDSNNQMFNLSDDSIKEAIREGENGLDNFTKIEKQYKLKILENKLTVKEPSITVTTPYLNIVMFSYLKSSDYKTFTFEEAKKIASVTELGVSINAFGEDMKFTQNVNVVIKQGSKIIQPKYILGNDKLANFTATWPKSPAFKSTIMGYFSLDELDLSKEAELIYLHNGKENSATYKLEFSKYK
ncbi:copper amine oxidase N-terminal domain-containing protein [Paenibacillus piri]|uniref:copper amine oxidase N-terminal domain-containing protein n=1 Tax=Paenibacillus piri TaxID=2547395 RepID=UPI0014048D2A|nr:copper amine oxidase N-terminal domain-containing protein [Paenibacillus piri]